MFYPGTALHDGAVIIRGERIIAAACVLPLTGRELADASLGTRHRAAVGITEQNDALAIVVSEETGTISVARNGRLARRLDVQRLGRVLQAFHRPRRLVWQWILTCEKLAIESGFSAARPGARRDRVGGCDTAGLSARRISANQSPVSRLGLPENLSVFGDILSEVRVEIQAPKDRWGNLQARDFTAWVDLDRPARRRVRCVGAGQVAGSSDPRDGG